MATFRKGRETPANRAVDVETMGLQFSFRHNSKTEMPTTESWANAA